MTNAGGYFLLLFALLCGVGVQGSSEIKLFQVTPDRVEVNETTDVNIRIEIESDIESEFNSSLRVIGLIFSNTWLLSVNTPLWIILTVQNGQCDVNETMTELVSCDLDRGLFEVTLKNSTGPWSTIYPSFKEAGYFNDSRITVMDMLDRIERGNVSRVKHIGYRRPDSLQIEKSRPDDHMTNYVTLTPGDEFTMVCRLKNGMSNDAFFTWYVNTSMSPDDSSVITKHHRPTWSTFRECYTQPNLELTLRGKLCSSGVRAGEEGYYRCEALYNPEHVGRFISQTVHINVIYKPETNPNTETVQEVINVVSGTTVTLRWNVIANPAPDGVTWYRQSRVLTEGSTYQLRSVEKMNGYEYSLQFTARKETFGFYHCEVTNSRGKSTIQFLITRNKDKLEMSQPTPDVTAETKPQIGRPTKAEHDRLAKRVEVLTVILVALIVVLVVTITIIVVAVIVFTKARHN